jgi:hypothetical protein
MTLRQLILLGYLAGAACILISLPIRHFAFDLAKPSPDLRGTIAYNQHDVERDAFAYTLDSITLSAIGGALILLAFHHHAVNPNLWPATVPKNE